MNRRNFLKIMAIVASAILLPDKKEEKEEVSVDIEGYFPPRHFNCGNKIIWMSTPMSPNPIYHNMWSNSLADNQVKHV